MTSTVIECRGTRAVEARLLDDLEALLRAAEEDPALLARPVRVVVPSRSLRLHVAGASLRRRRRAAAGVVVQTHYSVALEILDRAGETAAAGQGLIDLIPRRLARREAALRASLEPLVDAYGAVAAGVTDLLDAGFEPDLHSACDEALATDAPRFATGPEIERAHSLLRVAAGTQDRLDALGLAHISTLLRRSVDHLELEGGNLLPARAVLIYGFADATGLVTDLLQSLQRRCAATVYLDLPPGLELGSFGRRLRERLTLEPEPRDRTAAGGGFENAEIESFDAAGAEAEIREAALRIRELLDGGGVPERVALVARDLDSYRLPIRRHFDRLGIPFSGSGERGSIGPAGRRLGALFDLLRQRRETPVDRWIQALGSSLGPALGTAIDSGAAPSATAATGFELRLAFSALGASRLREVAELEIEPYLRGGRFPLPLRHGLVEIPGDEGDGPDESTEPSTRAARRSVDGEDLRRAVGAAAELSRRLETWPAAAPLAEHARILAALLAEPLRWPHGDPGRGDLDAAIENLLARVPGLELDLDEVLILLGRALEGAGFSKLGGEGGGVQVLTVTEARGLSFDHLFLAGMNRDLFPRPVREDPLFADDLRRALVPLLPDLPLKRTGYNEERFLFAQLLSASPQVTLSWQIVNDEGTPRSPSPLLAGLPAAARRSEDGDGTGGLEKPPWEHLIAAGRSRFDTLLPVVLADTLSAGTPLPQAGEKTFAAPARLAAFRSALLDEIDPDLSTPEGRAIDRRLGPFFGYLGPVRGPGDPRRRPLFITLMEALARCPWQVFLTRLLGIEPTPDPLHDLPAIDAAMVGSFVHRVLEDIAGREPAPLPWPAQGELEEILHRRAAETIAESGLGLPGLSRALVEVARPRLEEARRVDWPDGRAPAVLGAEIEGELEIHRRRIRFKADRVDLSRRAGRSPGEESAALVLTDYKTGGHRWDYAKPETRRGHLLRAVRSGRALQAMAYALAGDQLPDQVAAQASDQPAIGRYLFLAPDLAHRDFAVSGDDPDFADAFGEAAAAILAAWESGSFFPRLIEGRPPKEPRQCTYCAVAEACLRGDSGARRRLRAWTETMPSAPGEESDPLHALWGLGAGERR